LKSCNEDRKSSEEIPSLLLEASRLVGKGLRDTIESWRSEFSGLVSTFADVYESQVNCNLQDVFSSLEWPIPATPLTRNRVFSKYDPAYAAAFAGLANPTSPKDRCMVRLFFTLLVLSGRSFQNSRFHCV
jgi:hypothetical protein